MRRLGPAWPTCCRRQGHHRAGGFAEPGCAARENSRPARCAGDEAGDFDQHTRVATGSGHQGKIGEGMNNFRFEISNRGANNNNVNRRFTGRGLKFAEAEAHDETTKEKKVIWLTSQTSWKN